MITEYNITIAYNTVAGVAYGLSSSNQIPYKIQERHVSIGDEFR